MPPSSGSSSSLITRIPLTPIERGWPARRYSILNEVLGPDFHGPSSSHTAAPQMIALDVYHTLGGVPHAATVYLINSFGSTGEGHRTRVAVIAGLLGFSTTDSRTPDAVAIAHECGLFVKFESKDVNDDHPNTLVLDVTRGTVAVHVKGVSIGGGNFEIGEKKISSIR